MKTNYTITAVIILAGLSSAAAADYFQDFDSMGTTGTTAPAGWSMRYITGNSLSVDIPTSSDMAFASVLGSSSLAVWNQPSAPISWSQQAANMGASPTASNRLLGTSPSSYRGSILQLSLNNNSGAPVYTVQLTYDMQTMASGVLSGSFEPGAIEELPGYRFYYLDGSTWTRLGDLGPELQRYGLRHFQLLHSRRQRRHLAVPLVRRQCLCLLARHDVRD